jgi:hypothetical protein
MTLLQDTASSNMIGSITDNKTFVYAIVFLVLSSVITIIQQYYAHRLKLQSMITMDNLVDAINQSSIKTHSQLGEIHSATERLMLSNSKEHEKVYTQIAKIPKSTTNNLTKVESLHIIKRVFIASKQEIITAAYDIIDNNNITAVGKLEEVQSKINMLVKNLYIGDANLLAGLKFNNKALDNILSGGEDDEVIEKIISIIFDKHTKAKSKRKVRIKLTLDSVFTSFYYKAERILNKVELNG